MIRNDAYLLRKIEDKYFLLPTGQEISKGRKSCQIDTIGARVWELLKDDLSKEEVAEKVSEDLYYEGVTADRIKSDIFDFIDSMTSKGFIRYSKRFNNQIKGALYKIGDFLIEIFDEHSILKDELKDFEYSSFESFDGKIKVYIDENHSPYMDLTGMPLVESSDVKVEGTDDFYLLNFKKNTDINNVIFGKKSEVVYINIKEYSKQTPGWVMAAVRMAYLYYALLKDELMIHSASICYKEKIWLFCAPSGTGKSTQAALWEANSDAKIINGDANLISLESGDFFVKGTPWCGTSGIYDNKTYKLGGIVLLQRAETAKVIEMTTEDKILGVTRRVISPTWDKQMMSVIVDCVERLCHKISVVKLSCNMAKESFEVMKEYIDGL